MPYDFRSGLEFETQLNMKVAALGCCCCTQNEARIHLPMNNCNCGVTKSTRKKGTKNRLRFRTILCGISLFIQWLYIMDILEIKEIKVITLKEVKTMV